VESDGNGLPKRFAVLALLKTVSFGIESVFAQVAKLMAGVEMD
jgi:hypothetical protein